jgi:hypothetical protein
MESILTRNGVALDRAISYSGNGAIRINATGATVIRLAEGQPQDAEGVVLMYRGHVRTANLMGRTYLEMSCTIAGKTESLSTAPADPVTGTTDWVRQEAQLSLDKGQRAQTVRLNLVIQGRGIVWVDNIVLAQSLLVGNQRAERRSRKSVTQFDPWPQTSSGANLPSSAPARRIANTRIFAVPKAVRLAGATACEVLCSASSNTDWKRIFVWTNLLSLL